MTRRTTARKLFYTAVCKKNDLFSRAKSFGMNDPFLENKFCNCLQ